MIVFGNFFGKKRSFFIKDRFSQTKARFWQRFLTKKRSFLATIFGKNDLFGNFFGKQKTIVFGKQL